MTITEKLRKLLFILFTLLFAIVFGVSAYMLYQEISVYKQGEDAYSSLSDMVIIKDESKPGDTRSEEEKRVIDFAKLTETNPDTVGWIYIPGTHIDYPVVKGKDNNKYLNTLFTGERNKAGAIFVDSRHHDPFQGQNTTIYGHNMKNKSMFHDLLEFREQTFYDSHKVGYFYTKDGVYALNIFSVYTTDGDGVYVQTTLGANPQGTINQFLGKSEIRSNMSPSADSKIVTLSTCAYNFNNARCVVHAVVEKR